jgi:hypothetical protein
LTRNQSSGGYDIVQFSRNTKHLTSMIPSRHTLHL